MRTLRITTVITALFSLVATQSASAAYAESPMQSIKNTNTRLNRLLRQKTKKGSAAAKKIDAKLKKVVNSFLDFSELAKRALGKHWAKRTPKEQAEFVSILRDLIEKNYLKQLRGNMDYKLEYRNEKVDGANAHVVTAVKVEKDGRTDELVIEYKMRKSGRKWMVYDVITDDVSVVRNYRSQFNRIINKDSYEALVQKMRRKLEKI